ncbi:MAG: hypothetical protein JW814_11850 [Candidatus Krumholzibacteriota bacterium]|nr:hypothetical protein [Candidatus Krumholzibacteriota bacterium]
MFRILIILIMAIFFSSCGGKRSEKTGKDLTRAQKDSVLAESDLPGAKVVGKAISVADSAAARAERLYGETQK